MQRGGFGLLMTTPSQEILILGEEHDQGGQRNATHFANGRDASYDIRWFNTSPSSDEFCFLDDARWEKVDLMTRDQVAVPRTTTLISSSIHHTWLVIDPDASGNLLGLTTSSGAVAVVGGRL